MTELLTDEECEALQKQLPERSEMSLTEGYLWRALKTVAQLRLDLQETQRISEARRSRQPWLDGEPVTQERVDALRAEGAAYRALADSWAAKCAEYENRDVELVFSDETQQDLFGLEQDNKMLHMELERLRGVMEHSRFDAVMEARNKLIDDMYEDGNGPTAEQRAELDVLDTQLDDMTRAKDNLTLWPAETQAMYAECVAARVEAETAAELWKAQAMRFEKVVTDAVRARMWLASLEQHGLGARLDMHRAVVPCPECASALAVMLGVIHHEDTGIVRVNWTPPEAVAPGVAVHDTGSVNFALTQDELDEVHRRVPPEGDEPIQAVLNDITAKRIDRLERNIDEARKLARRYRDLHPDSRNNPLPWGDA